MSVIAILCAILLVCLNAFFVAAEFAVIKVRATQIEAQARSGSTPTYKLVDQSGPDHDKKFLIAAYVGNEKIAHGEGKSKQEAEQDAAQKALVVKGW